MIKKLFLALAVVAVAAGCAKENGTGVDDGTRNVKIRVALPTSFNGTRADTDVAAAGALTVDPDNSYIFIANASGTIVNRVQMTAAALVAGPNVTPAAGQTITGVPSDGKVFVLANIDDYNTVKAYPTLAGVQGHTREMSSQDGLYDQAVMSSISVIEVSSGTTSGTTVTLPVDISPVYARLELLEIQSQSAATAHSKGEIAYLTGYTVTGVFVDEVYEGFTYAAGHTNDLLSVGMTEANLATLLTANGFSHTKAKDAVGAWAATPVAVVGDVCKMSHPDGAWGFNVPAGSQARLILRIEDIKANVTNGTADTADDTELAVDPTLRYITVTGYNKTYANGDELDPAESADTSLKAGTVYKVGSAAYNSLFEFGYSNIYGDPNPEDVSLLVQVTVLDWEFVGYGPILAK